MGGGDLGLRLAVDARQVREARGQVELLNKGLRETEDFEDLRPGGKGLSDSAKQVRALADDVRRLHSIALSGERQGGILPTGRFKEAATLSQRIRESFSGLTENLRKARGELDSLIARKRILEEPDPGRESASEMRQRRAAIRGIDGAIREKRTEFESLSSRARQIEDARSRGMDAAESIAGMGTAAPRGSWTFGRMARYGLGIMGGFTLAGFLSDSMAKEAAFATGATDLLMRGGNASRTGTYGFTPGEGLGIADALNRATGLAGDGLDRLGESVKRFSRGLGTGPDAPLGLVAGIFGATGRRGGFDRTMQQIRDVLTVSGNRGRVDELLSSHVALLQAVALGTGGFRLSSGVEDRLLGLQSSMGAAAGGRYGIAGDVLGKVSAAISGGGGSSGSQAFMFAALGGARVGSLRSLEDLERRMELGIGGEGTRAAILGTAKRLWGSDGSGGLSDLGRRQLKAMFGLKWGELDLFLNAKEGIPRLGGGLEGDAARAAGTTGGIHRQTIAGLEELKLEIGGTLLPLVDRFKSALTDSIQELRTGNVASGLTRALKDNPLGAAMLGLGLAEGVRQGLPTVAGAAFGAGAAGVAGAVGGTLLRAAPPVAVGVGSYLLVNEANKNTRDFPIPEDQRASRQEVLGIGGGTASAPAPLRVEISLTDEARRLFSVSHVTSPSPVFDSER